MPRDSGLQPERTALAWQRTAYALLTNGALLVRAALEKRSLLLGAASGLVILSAAALIMIGIVRHGALLRSDSHAAPNALLIVFACIAVIATCCAGLLSELG